MGARLSPVEARGYGNALMGGIAAARGRYVIMGDADDSYDFLEIPRFVAKLREGLRPRARLPAARRAAVGDARRDAVLASLVGQPDVFTAGARWFAAAASTTSTAVCAASPRSSTTRLNQRCTGMEFATEMIIKASLYGERIAEVPITLHPDGRKAHAPHLKTFRDGWRTLRFFLMYSPRWLFLMPGALLVLLGLVGYAVAMPGREFAGVSFDAHTLLFASLAILCGYQSILFHVFTKTFAINEGLMPEDPLMTRFYRVANLERGLIVASVALIVGCGLLLAAVNQWRLVISGNSTMPAPCGSWFRESP